MEVTSRISANVKIITDKRAEVIKEAVIYAEPAVVCFQIFFRLKNTRAVIAIYQMKSSCLDMGCIPTYCKPSKKDFPKEKTKYSNS